jgi:hypothetical protein
LFHDPGRGARLGKILIQEQRQAHRLVRQESVPGIDREPPDLLGSLGGDFLDVDAAGGTHHEPGPGLVHVSPHASDEISAAGTTRTFKHPDP